MKSKGIQVTVVDTRPWAEATKAAREELIGKIPDGQALYQEINAAKQSSAVASK
jgi:TRAP-type transport system periplasmic protein